MIKLDNLQLNDHLIWRDEYSYVPLSQATEYSITGSLIVDNGIKKAGRPITLSVEPGQGNVTRADVDALVALVNSAPHTPMQLQLHDGRIFKVIWRAHDGQPVESGVHYDAYADPLSQDYATLTLRFMEVI